MATVRYFAGAREAAGTETESVEARTGGELHAALDARHEALAVPDESGATDDVDTWADAREHDRRAASAPGAPRATVEQHESRRPR